MREKIDRNQKPLAKRKGTYLNETEVGNAVRKSDICREDIFLVSKVWFGNYGSRAHAFRGS